MIQYFARHPTAANILMFAIVLLGLAALPTLNKETFPQIATNKLQISIAYPGASPSEVEEGICQRLEDATDGISFMEEQACVARDNIGIMTLDMNDAGNMQQFTDDVKAAIDAITDFPENSEEPVIQELGRTDLVAGIAISANLSQPELKALAEYYRQKLLADPAIPIVTVSGFSTHELSILVKPDMLRQYQLSIDDIAQLIAAQALDMPAGTLDTDSRSYQIRIENARHTVDELADLIVLNDDKGGQIRLGDIATIEDNFSDEETRTEFNGMPAALLTINKNKTDDTLTVYHALQAFVTQENARLPAGTRLIITQDIASIVQDRLNLLLHNGWQGLLLATLTLLLFFSWRYTFWVALGLPISFLGGLAVMAVFGVTINMISMVALLMAIGILMDDAIVISESIEHEYQHGKAPLDAVVSGIKKVARGVISSYATSAILFGSLLFLQGDMGQIMRILPIVLLSVLTISLIEAFLVLPNHLKHSLEKHKNQEKQAWQLRFETHFNRFRESVGRLSDTAVQYRYAVVGTALAMLIVSIGLIPAGIVKFKSFPDLEGDLLDARILMPQGTPFHRTEEVVAILLQSLQQALDELPAEQAGDLIQNIQIAYGTNSDADENGKHLATISLDLLSAELRQTSLHELRRLWLQKTPAIPDALVIQFKEPQHGPAGQAIDIRLQGHDLKQLSAASWQLQHWLAGYPGVTNLMDDLRPGKPQFVIDLLPGALDSGVNTATIANQLRAAYQGTKVNDVYQGQESYEINVKLDTHSSNSLAELESLGIVAKQQVIPLAALASMEETREFSRISRINHLRTVTLTGDIDAELANTNEIIRDTRERFLPSLLSQYPDLHISLEGEVKNSRETNVSVLSGFVLGIAGVFLLLSLQFGNYREPLVVLMNIPLALIGVIWGHLLLGLDITMPSMVGFVSLAGVVVNDSILLVEFVKRRNREGMGLHDAASQAVRDRFRAILLTSVTTVAGMLPLLSETSLQAQVLIPLIASVVFGMISSTLLLLLVLPSAYAIMEDMGVLATNNAADA